MFTHVFFDGEIIPDEEANVHVMTPCVRYGASVFEVVRAYWNDQEQQLYLFQLQRHAARMVDSAKLLRLQEQYTADDISAAMLTLLRYLRPKDDVSVWTRIFVDGRGPVESTGPLRICSVAIPGIRGFGPKWVDGLHACVSSWRRIDDRSMPPRIKTPPNYQNSRLAQTEALANGYDAALFLNSAGKVAEGTGACLVMVRDGVISTPPVTAGILEGIARATVMALSSESLGLEVLERDIDRTELYLADELFLCGTGAEVAPILSVDQHKVGDGSVGKVTARLRDLYLAVARRTDESHQDWRTPVYD